MSAPSGNFVTLNPKTKQLQTATGKIPRIAADSLEVQSQFDLPFLAYEQATSNTTAVAITTPTGTIEMFGNLTTAAGVTSSTFDVTWTYPLVGVPIFQVSTYSGTWTTNGLPFAVVTARDEQSATVAIVNAHGANALLGTVTLSYIMA